MTRHTTISASDPRATTTTRQHRQPFLNPHPTPSPQLAPRKDIPQAGLFDGVVVHCAPGVCGWQMGWSLPPQGMLQYIVAEVVVAVIVAAFVVFVVGGGQLLFQRAINPATFAPPDRETPPGEPKQTHTNSHPLARDAPFL